jgi:2-polyprenyl-6-methoxyphenol hydroxylase-like FAD-dependent oxidoreductase
MGDVLVLGGGLCGLATAMMLARDGNDVTVLERDPQGPPSTIDEAIVAWDRPSVPQFHLGHYMHAKFRHVLQEELPDVVDALLEDGANRFDIMNAMWPETVTDRSPRPNDDDYWTVTGRREMLEKVFASKAEDERGVKVVRGVRAVEPLVGAATSDGVPHITGVKAASGETFTADVIVDAMGRKSPLPEWITSVGGAEPWEESFDCGFIYYGRYYHSENGMPEMRGRALANVGSISLLVLPSDNNTWFVLVWTATGDQALKNLRFEDRWENVVRAVPTHEQFLVGEPLHELQTMGGIMDGRRRFVIDGAPVVTGILPVADALAYTNPSLGRGVSLGLSHAQHLRSLLKRTNGDPLSVATEWDEISEREFVPWYQAQVNMDQARVNEIVAIREGREVPADPMTQGFFTAMNHDADCYRAFLEIMGCLSTPEEILARPGMFEKMIAAADGKEPHIDQGPSREQLLALVS